jgi:hypothetical protein
MIDVDMEDDLVDYLITSIDSSHSGLVSYQDFASFLWGSDVMSALISDKSGAGVVSCSPPSHLHFSDANRPATWQGGSTFS